MQQANSFNHIGVYVYLAIKYENKEFSFWVRWKKNNKKNEGKKEAVWVIIQQFHIQLYTKFGI